MTTTPTEEDLRLAREWLDSQDKQPIASWQRTLAAFRAEARREAEEHWRKSTGHKTPEDAWRHVNQQRGLAVEEAVQSEREACERIVAEELGDMIQQGTDEVYPEACLNAILTRLRERAK